MNYVCAKFKICDVILFKNSHIMWYYLMKYVYYLIKVALHIYKMRNYFLKAHDIIIMPSQNNAETSGKQREKLVFYCGLCVSI